MKPSASLQCRIGAAVVALWLSACSSPMPAAKPSTTASQATAPMSLLWVGNSFFYYNNSMHGHVGLLLRASAEGSGARP